MTRYALLSGLGHAVLVALGLLVYVLATRIGQQRRHPSAALGWVMGIVAFPYLAIPAFLLLGTRKIPRPHRRRRPGRPSGPDPSQAPGAAPAWATQLLQGMELAPAVCSTQVRFHDHGEQALEALLGGMDAARRSLQVSTFVYGDDVVGQHIGLALARAAQRGVHTQLLIDAVGSLRISSATLRQLQGAGVRVRRFMPMLHNPMRGRANLRNHRKIVVADGEWFWSGGRNLAAQYFAAPPARAAWIDLSYELRGPLAAQASAQFTADWLTATGHAGLLLPAPVDTPDTLCADGVWTQWIPSGPDHADDTLHALLLAAAFHAQQRIILVTPYFVPDEALLDAWCLACRRGVHVSLLLPRQSNHRLADWARERALRQLVQAGGQVWLTDGMLHAKAVVVDEALALAGSLNLDGRSLFLNYECMTAFYGPDAIQWLGDWAQRQIAVARAEQPRQPSWLRDIGEGVVRAVGFQL